MLGRYEIDLPADVRIGRQGSENSALTKDYRLGGFTVELDDEREGCRVTSVTLELPDGPELLGLTPADRTDNRFTGERRQPVAALAVVLGATPDASQSTPTDRSQGGRSVEALGASPTFSNGEATNCSPPSSSAMSSPDTNNGDVTKF